MFIVNKTASVHKRLDWDQTTQVWLGYSHVSHMLTSKYLMTTLLCNKSRHSNRKWVKTFTRHFLVQKN